MKDLLIDNTVAKNFCNPLDENYKALIDWIFRVGALVVTQNLLVDYHRTSAASPSSTSMPALVARLTRDGRLRRFTKEELETIVIDEHVRKRLRSNWRDHPNIQAVMLSARKFALSHDANFRYDVTNFRGFRARAERRPQDLPYAD